MENRQEKTVILRDKHIRLSVLQVTQLIAWGNFPGYNTWWGSQTNHGSLHELRRQNMGFWEVTLARICRVGNGTA